MKNFENIKNNKMVKNSVKGFAILGTVVACALGNTACVSQYYDENGRVVGEYSNVGEVRCIMDGVANILGATAPVGAAAFDFAASVHRDSTINRMDRRHVHYLERTRYFHR